MHHSRTHSSAFVSLVPPANFEKGAAPMQDRDELIAEIIDLLEILGLVSERDATGSVCSAR